MSSSVSATSPTGDIDAILRGGDLRDHDVLQILAVFHARLLTGIVHVTGPGEFRASIYTMDGDVIAAESQSAAPSPQSEVQRLGRRLLRKGLLDESQLKATLTGAKDTERLGELLVRHGHLDDEALQGALSEQFQDIFFLACLLQQGSFRAETRDAVFPRNLQLLFDTPELLGEGQRLRERLGNLVNALQEGGFGLAPGSAARSQRLKGADLAIVAASQEDRRLESILEKSPLEQIATLETITGLLERRALALAPIKDDASDADSAPSSQSKGSFISSLRRGEDGSGQFMSQDTVLDVVDLSSVNHFTVATDIPLSMVVETLGLEDLDEEERARAQRDAQSVDMKAPEPKPDASPPPAPRTPQPLSSAPSVSPPPVKALMDGLDDDDDDDDLLFTEDGRAVPEDRAEALIASNLAPRGERRAPPKPLSAAQRALGAAPPPASSEPVGGLSPRQRQSLQRRFQIYNQIFQTLFTHFCQYARKLEVLTHFQGYFASKDKRFPALFEGAAFRTNGTLKPDIILDNLETHTYEHPAEAFDLALHEVLSYLLKDARKLLPNAEAEARMMEAVGEIRRQLFRRGANVPPLGR